MGIFADGGRAGDLRSLSLQTSFSLVCSGKASPFPVPLHLYGSSGSGRGRPFQFILNHSRATATNVYLMLYPKPILAKVLSEKPELQKEVWSALDRISDEALMCEGRVYGGGLHKLEPRELGNTLASRILEILPKCH